MSIQERYELVTDWQQGVISSSDLTRLISLYYAENFGMNRNSCKPCELTDVKHYFRFQLKQNGYKEMADNKKYLLPEGTTSIRMHGSGITYTFDGPETATNKNLTNKQADELIEKHPELLSEGVLKLNPAYNPELEPETAPPVAPLVKLTAKQKKELAEKEAAKKLVDTVSAVNAQKDPSELEKETDSVLPFDTDTDTDNGFPFPDLSEPEKK